MTTGVLRSRLDNYSYQKNKGYFDTNDRICDEIRQQLDQDIVVNIYGIKQAGKSKLEIETLESQLINNFDPDWNRKK